MSNRRRGIVDENDGILRLMITIIVLFVVALFFWVFTKPDPMKEYANFCDERPDFCYCNKFIITLSCEYKISETCINGICNKSKNSQELCDLATKLDDEEMIFKAC
jgi:hypothetical protein